MKFSINLEISTEEIELLTWAACRQADTQNDIEFNAQLRKQWEEDRAKRAEAKKEGLHVV